MEENISDERQINSNHSRPSFDSIQEISAKKEYFFRISLILINIASIILGLYIINHRDFFLSPDYKFINYISLYVFIITYTLGMLLALILSFLIALVAKILSIFRDKKQNISINDLPNLINNEQPHSRMSEFILNNKKNEIAIIPFTVSYFIAITIGLYFIALPYSFCLLINLLRNEFYSKVFEFSWLYLFLIINLIAGLIMIIILFSMVFIKRSGSVRKFEYPVDNNNIENIRAEVKEAINN